MSESSFTELLHKSNGDDPFALDRLLPVVYEELRRLAKRQMGQQRDAHTLQPTALVNEAYLRLIDQDSATLEDRAHFYSLCARIMRQILVDHSRRRNADKRGAGQVGRFGTAIEVPAAEGLGIPDLVVFHDALERLEQEDNRKARVVELRVFSGMTVEEVAGVLGVSKRTVEADWFFARAWLRAATG